MKTIVEKGPEMADTPKHQIEAGPRGDDARALGTLAGRYQGGLEDPALPNSSRMVWLVMLTIAALGVWAYFAELDEVSAGTGKVVPSSREQVIQSLEGGILADLRVREGDIVVAGQVLAQLDRTRGESSVQESTSRFRAALATAARLEAEVSLARLVFPPEVHEDPALVIAETKLYSSRRDSLDKALAGIGQSLRLVRDELELTQRLVKMGAASDVEVLRLRRQVTELESRATDLRTQYVVRAREELARANAEVEAQSSVTRGRADQLTRTTLTSPVRGVVKNIEVNTVGGVIPPNGRLMEIVPLDEQLLVEARISPRDIAFIRPGLPAMVKVTAYDYAIYGGLPGEVTIISPDTIQDEVKRDVYYYRVFIRTDTDALLNEAGTRFPIVPGMIAAVDIRTGSKTVFDYLVKPLNRAREALRER